MKAFCRAFFQPSLAVFPFANYRDSWKEIHCHRWSGAEREVQGHSLDTIHTKPPEQCWDFVRWEAKLELDLRHWRRGGAKFFSQVSLSLLPNCLLCKSATFPTTLTTTHELCKIPGSKSVPGILAALAPAQRTNVLFLLKVTIPNTRFGFSPF